MSRYHRVGPGVWAQPWSDDARMLALYLLTTEHRTAEGLFRLPTPYVVEDMRWPLDRIEAAYRELEQDGFVLRDPEAKVVLIVNALQWQSPANPNGVSAAVRKLAELPSTALLCTLLEQADRYCERLADGIREGLHERLSSSCEEPLSSSSDTTPAPSLAPPPSTAPSGKPDAGGADNVEPAKLDDARDRLQSTQVQAVFDAWLSSRAEQHGTRPSAKLDEKRRRIIRRALASHGFEDTLAAVQGWRHSPHHRGENERHRPFDDLELLLRDSKHIEEFRDLHLQHAGRPAGGSGLAEGGGWT